jgi:dinuclear metal center YbgI/SA1388 family protein
MIDIDTLRVYCDELLACAERKDYCPNGLQVEGDRQVRCLVSGVTASQALIDAAIAEGADALLVHHGYFWNGESSCLVGMKGRRIRTLMRAGASLFAYHLPLDAHPELGNNRQLGRVLGILDASPAVSAEGLLWQGRLPNPEPAANFSEHIARALGRNPLHVPAHDRSIETLAWCTGGAQGYIEQAAGLGVDAFLSGEISEQTTHQARELGLDYFAAGHHASERYGVKALGAHLAERFGINHRFLDLDNPA